MQFMDVLVHNNGSFILFKLAMSSLLRDSEAGFKRTYLLMTERLLLHSYCRVCL